MTNKIFILSAALALTGVLYAGALTSNILSNPGAETGDLTGWTSGATTGTISATGALNGVTPHGGSFDFFGGSLQAFNNSSITQTVSLVGGSVTAAAIDTGTLFATSSFWEQSVDGHAGPNIQSNSAGFAIGFQDANHVLLGTVLGTSINSNNGAWSFYTLDITIPTNARFLVYTLNFSRTGVVNTTTNAFADDLSVIINDPSTGGTPPPGINTPEPSEGMLVMAGAALLLAVRHRLAG